MPLFFPYFGQVPIQFVNSPKRLRRKKFDDKIITIQQTIKNYK